MLAPQVPLDDEPVLVRCELWLRRQVEEGAGAIGRCARDRVTVIRRGGRPALNAVEIAEDRFPRATDEEAGRVVHALKKLAYCRSW